MLNWSGETCVVICAGPSLLDAQLDVVRSADVKTIAVNGCYEYAPWADVVFAGDYMFWKVHHARIGKACPNAALWTCDTTAASRYQINRARVAQRDGLGLKVVHSHGNSGFQALGLAFLWGSRKILLIGMDMRLGPHGEKHRHGDHEKPLVQAQLFDQWLHASVKLAKDLKANGCSVVNATPGSALTVFPFMAIEDAL